MKYDLKKIMLNAWKNYRRYSISFAEALHRAWLQYLNFTFRKELIWQ